MSVARYRERHCTSGAKSDAGDAHVLAEIVRVDRDHHRRIAGDSGLVEAIKMVARMHQTLVWDRQRQVLRLRSTLREFFPAALDVFDDLGGADTLELLQHAPDPARAAALSRTKIAAALRRAPRRDVQAKAAAIQAGLRAERVCQPAVVDGAYAAIVTTHVRMIALLNTQIAELAQDADTGTARRVVRQVRQHEQPPLVHGSEPDTSQLDEREPWFAAFIDLLVTHGADQATTVAAVDRLADLFAATCLGWWELAARRDQILSRLGRTPDQCGALVALLAGSRHAACRGAWVALDRR